jgi:hypothetical protein
MKRTVGLVFLTLSGVLLIGSAVAQTAPAPTAPPKVAPQPSVNEPAILAFRTSLQVGAGTRPAGSTLPRVTLTWSAYPNAKAYTAQWSFNASGPWNTLATASSTSVTAPVLPKIAIYYRVQTSGVSSPEDSTNVATFTAPLPASTGVAPGMLPGSAMKSCTVGALTASLTWYPVGDATAYVVNQLGSTGNVINTWQVPSGTSLSQTLVQTSDHLAAFRVDAVFRMPGDTSKTQYGLGTRGTAFQMPAQSGTSCM